MLLYHATNVPNIDIFYDLSHFGTLKSAMNRSSYHESSKVYFYECEVDISEFIQIQDFGNETDMFHHDLYIQKIITSNDIKKMPSMTLSNILHNKNIKGFYYDNVAEDVGNISYIVNKGHDVKIKNIYDLDYIRNKFVLI